MAIIESGDGTGFKQTVEDNNSGRIVILPRGIGYSLTVITGTMAAALAANSTVFAMRLNPSSTKRAFITRLFASWVTIAAFTVSITAGRRLSMFRGVGAAASGGTAIATTFKKESTSAPSQFGSTLGGDIRVATTGTLTTTGITFEAEEKFTLHLTGSGTAGAGAPVRTDTFVGDIGNSWSIIIRPGELLSIRNPVAMDAGGTWQLALDFDWFEI